MTEFERQNQTQGEFIDEYEPEVKDEGPNYGQWNQGPYPNEPQNNGPWNNGPYPNGPQNNGQWNNGPYPNGPQNNGQWNNGPYSNGPYQNPYNPYNRPPKRRNGFATAALVSGIMALLNLCCFSFPTAIIMGVGAISIAIISKKGEPMTKTAIAAVVLGVIAIVLGVVEFFYSLWLSDLLKDPANIAMFNQLVERFEREFAAQASGAAQ